MTIARQLAGGIVALLLGTAPCLAQQAIKIGLVLPLSGPFTPTGKQLAAGARLYMEQKGHTVRRGSGGGAVQLITIEPESGVLLGGSDPRAGGMALGY